MENIIFLHLFTRTRTQYKIILVQERKIITTYLGTKNEKKHKTTRSSGQREENSSLKIINLRINDSNNNLSFDLLYFILDRYSKGIIAVIII